MEQTKESRFLGNKSKFPVRQNGLKDSNRIQQKNNSISSIKANRITPSQALKEMSKEKRPSNQQNHVTKNIWMSSFRDIIKDEPVKINHIKKAPIEQNKNQVKKTPVFKPNNNTSRNQSSKPIFTISASLKNSMQQQSPKIKNNPDVSKISKSTVSEAAASNNITNDNKSKLIHTETPKIPKKIESPKIPVTQNTLIVPKSPNISSNRSPSPISIQSVKHNQSQKDNNKTHKSLSVFVFLIIMFIIMFYSPAFF